jgi:hypothetical protein
MEILTLGYYSKKLSQHLKMLQNKTHRFSYIMVAL